MKIKSAKLFRSWYKTKFKDIEPNNPSYNENFVGTYHTTNEKKIKGFFEMYHGDKGNIYDFLRKEVEMAEDGQAIYEFVQNAADSASSQFYMFYDEEYLLVINNGEVFSKEGIKSILNIGQSNGKEGPDKIGRYGIGFKLVHRLVGKSSGLDELLNQDKKGYRGPILFSWSEKSQLTNFVHTNQFDYVDFEDNTAPWLLKILITNFPAQPEEKVKGVEFEETEPFHNEELKAFQSFIVSHRSKIDWNAMDNGSIFFIKLGHEKFQYLEKQKQEYVHGLSTSMHFLKSLEKLTINDTFIVKDKEASSILEFIIPNGSDSFNKIGLTENRDKESDAKFKICFASNAQSANEIKKHPTIYKYFPAVKEVNNLAFVIHSNLFELSSNRQNLTETPINKNLLTLLANQIIAKMEDCKKDNKKLFKSLFTSILMCDENVQNWQNDCFYVPLLEYIKCNIPTKLGYCDTPKNVKINKLKFPLRLSDFGLEHIQWLDWDTEVDLLLLHEASKKLGIEEWDSRDIVENGKVESIDNWIKNCDVTTYLLLLAELEKSNLRIKTKEKICKIKLFQFSDSTFYSFDEIISSKDKEGKTSFLFGNCFINNLNIKPIVNELMKLDFVISNYSTLDYPTIFSSITLPEDKKYYHLIAEKCKTNNLSPTEKKKLFLNFCNQETKFNGIADETLKKLYLFCNSQGSIKPLSEMVSSAISTPSWINAYKIKSEEYFHELSSYLIQQEEIFSKIIVPNLEIIKDELTEVKEIKELINLFTTNRYIFFDEYIIQKQAKGFVIKDKVDTCQVISSNKETKDFIKTYLAHKLIILPSEFSDYGNEHGIIQGDDLHAKILDLVDVDKYKELLVEIVKYKSKYTFLQKLSEIKLNVNTEYTNEDYEYKILDLACSELKDKDYPKFKEKVIILIQDKKVALSAIPPLTDKIIYHGVTLSLSEILCTNDESNILLSKLLEHFVDVGLPKEKLDVLFGITKNINAEEIYNRLLSILPKTSNNDKQFIIGNAAQLVFVSLYFKDNSIHNIYVRTFAKSHVWRLDKEYYLNYFSFIEPNAILQYNDIQNYTNQFTPLKYKNELNYYKKPLLFSHEFKIPQLKKELSQNEQIDLVDFLFDEWTNNKKKTVIKNTNWSKINSIDTKTILGFNPNTCVYPSEYACESEKLPDYVIQWINKDEQKIQFLSDFGVWIEDSILVELRRFLNNDTDTFNKTRITQTSRFNEDTTNLFYTFEWLQENEIKLTTQQQFETFEKIAEVINFNRTQEQRLIIEKECELSILEDNAKKWKAIDQYTIYLYNGTMPQTIKLDEIDDYIFYHYNDKDYAVNENIIYINENTDKKKALQKVASDEDNDFSFEILWSLFEEPTNEIEKLQQQIILLKNQLQLQNTTNATIGIDSSNDISEDDQKEANIEAKEIVKLKLESEGFEFTKEIGKYSTIDGVIKDGEEYPLVVKSYKYQDEPLKIGANEWIHLMKPNAMFWVYFGDYKVHSIKFAELLRNQDKLTISFSTENLDNKQDRLQKFAELLRYFKEVHFDFNTLKPNDYSVADDLQDYRFDERKQEQDLTPDDENLL